MASFAQEQIRRIHGLDVVKGIANIFIVRFVSGVKKRLSQCLMEIEKYVDVFQKDPFSTNRKYPEDMAEVRPPLTCFY